MKEEAKCSFCGIEASRTDKLSLGPGVAICDVCIEACRSPLDMGLSERLSSSGDKYSNAIEAKFKWGPINRGVAIRARFCCEYCGRSLLRSLNDYYSWQVDHIIPNRDDSLDNCALSCQVCNHLKHNFIPSGSTREELMQSAKREVAKRRSSKQQELVTLRHLLELTPLIDA